MTLKGLLAALSKVPCEEIYIFRIFLKMYDYSMGHEELLQQLGKEERDRVWRNFLERIKIDLLLFLQYHDENGMTLTHLKHLKERLSELESGKAKRKQEEAIAKLQQRLAKLEAIYSEKLRIKKH